MRKITRRTSPTHLLRRFGIVVALFPAIVGACETSSPKASAGSPNVVDQSVVESKRLDSTSVLELQLDSLSEIELGADSTQFPVKISSMHIAGTHRNN